MPHGVDVSHYQGIIDWSKPDFGWIKSSEGSGVADARYAAQRDAARRAGKPTGPYHFLRPGGDPVAQARFWRRCAGPLGPGDLRPAIDLEVDGFDAGWLRAFADEAARQFGCRPILYTYKSYLSSHGWLSGFHDLDLWIAAYTSTQPAAPGWNVVAWQYDDHAATGGDSDLAWQMSALLVPTASTTTQPPTEADMPLDDADKQFIRDTVLDIVRSEGVSGAADPSHSGVAQVILSRLDTLEQKEQAGGGSVDVGALAKAVADELARRLAS